ncbi:MAG: SUMF1/EgtB/PvdO family nonheme iron enzyme [Candidatus Electrothrix sp. YB6]
MGLGLKRLSFVSVGSVRQLRKQLKNLSGDQAQALNLLRDDFADPSDLARYYVEPHLQESCPVPQHGGHYFPAPRQAAFSLLNTFLAASMSLSKDGSRELILLGESGSGKTSLLLMIELMYLAGFWPKGYHCLLFRLDEHTLEHMEAIENKAETVLLLDGLNEDRLARNRPLERLLTILHAGEDFRRVILTCRSHFFPPLEADSSGRLRIGGLSGYNYPILYLAPFNASQIQEVTHNRLSRNTNYFQSFGVWRQRTRAAQLLAGAEKLRMRPVLLQHVEILLDFDVQKGRDVYAVYEYLIRHWLNRQIRRLEEVECESVPVQDELFSAFVRLACWMEEQDRTEVAEKKLRELFCKDADSCWLEEFQPDNSSLLHRTSKQAFRFTHSTYREFLLAYALIHDRTSSGTQPSVPVRATEQIVRFLDLAGGAANYVDRLDLAVFNPFRYVDSYRTLFFWQDRLTRMGKRYLKGPEMVMLPGGRFRMGDSQGSGSDDVRPVHEVELDTFAIGRYPVTFEEYDFYCMATGRAKPPDNGWGRKRRPVFNVSWQDANDYCDWLRRMTGRPYRLPTEAEWEYACRAGRDSAYCFGDDAEQLPEYAWYAENADNQTHPVGMKRANVWGLHDMYGNVWEWCSDRYDKDYYTELPVRNPSGTDQGAGRVLRGGSWDSSERFIRSCFRFCLSPGLRIIRVGFRVAQGEDE